MEGNVAWSPLRPLATVAHSPPTHAIEAMEEVVEEEAVEEEVVEEEEGKNTRPSRYRYRSMGII